MYPHSVRAIEFLIYEFLQANEMAFKIQSNELNNFENLHKRTNE